MKPSEEQLMAYADGELSGEERRAVEAALRADPELEAVVARQRALRRALETAFAPVVEEPVPDRLLAALQNTQPSWRWRLAQAATAVRNNLSSRQFVLTRALPVGIALACGLMIGFAIAPSTVLQAPFNAEEAVASGALDRALNVQLASDQAPDAPIRIGLSFRARDGRYCRTFSSAHSAGLACHQDGRWAIAALVPMAAERGAYRTAAGLPEAVRAAVVARIAGAPLDAAGEQAARDNRW